MYSVVLLLGISVNVVSQPFHREIETIPVIIKYDTLAQPFAGGIDGPNHRFVDIDGDGDYDLFIYDSDQLVDFYRNEGTPQHASFKLRPNEITLPAFTSWFYFVDLNGDGKIDLVTDNGSNSANYYTNEGTIHEPNFVLQASPMLDTSGAPIQCGYIGLPAFADLDGDGDYDFYISNFDGSITLYQNIGTRTSPKFRYADGRFQGVAIINDSCKKGSAILEKGAHHGGSILQFADINNDGAIDIFMGDLNSRSMFFLPNNGTATSPNIQCMNMHYPPDNSLITSGYNQPNLVDIDGDGDLDLFIGAFVNMGPTNMQRHTFWFYENVGNPSSPSFQLITKDYLSMLDVGRNAHPAFMDMNNDGKPDMLIGNVNGQLWYFENTGTSTHAAFTLQDTMFAQIRGSYTYAPVFVDLDGDGLKDLAVGQFDGYIRFYKNDGTISAAHFQSHAYDSVYVSPNSPCAPAFTDIDGDGDYDLFVGTANGHIRLYRNTGTRTVFHDTLVTTLFDSINVGEDANPVFVDIDHDGDDDLFIGNADGKLLFYEDSSGHYIYRTDMYGAIQPLKESAPAFVDIDQDGDLDLFLGTFKGGAHFYRNDAPLSVIEPDEHPNNFILYQNYPNPFNPSTVIRYTLVTNGYVALRVYTLLGEEVATLVNGFQYSGEKAIRFDGKNLSSGIYICKLTVSENEGGVARSFSQAKKIVLIR